MRSNRKNPNNYENIRKETNTYKQKLIKIDNFNDSEEAEVKERVNKRKLKRREIAENKKLLKKKEKKKLKKKRSKRKLCGSVFLN